MRVALLCLALSGCATVDPAAVNICAVQPLGVSQGMTIVRMHCEPEGEKV